MRKARMGEVDILVIELTIKGASVPGSYQGLVKFAVRPNQGASVFITEQPIPPESSRYVEELVNKLEGHFVEQSSLLPIAEPGKLPDGVETFDGDGVSFLIPEHGDADECMEPPTGQRNTEVGESEGGV